MSTPADQRNLRYDSFFTERMLAADSQQKKKYDAEVQARDLRLQVVVRNYRDYEASIALTERDQGALHDHEKGWLIEVFVLLALIAVGLEWVPASLYTLVFFDATGSITPLLMTVVFTTIGVLCAAVIGEIARRFREPAKRQTRDVFFLVLLTLGVLTFLSSTYLLRMAYALTPSGAVVSSPISAPVEAFALTVVATIAVVLAVTAGIYRESMKSARLRWTHSQLEREKARTLRQGETIFQDYQNARIADGLEPLDQKFIDMTKSTNGSTPPG